MLTRSDIEKFVEWFKSEKIVIRNDAVIFHNIETDILDPIVRAYILRNSGLSVGIEENGNIVTLRVISDNKDETIDIKDLTADQMWVLQFVKLADSVACLVDDAIKIRLCSEALNCFDEFFDTLASIERLQASLDIIGAVGDIEKFTEILYTNAINELLASSIFVDNNMNKNFCAVKRYI